MLNVRNIISRADELTLQKILSSQYIKLVQSLDEKYSKTSELKNLVFETNEEVHFIKDIKLRLILIDLLRKNEALLMADTLGFSSSASTCPYDYLKKKKIKHNSEEETVLYYLFGLNPPIWENDEYTVKPKNINENSLVKAEYQLFKHQREAICKLKTNLHKFPHRVLLHMPTGSGKTRTSMSLICDYLRNNEPFLVIWLASTEELCSQAFEEFNKAWKALGNREISIGKLWGNANIEDLFNIDEGIIIAGFQKLTSMINTSINQQRLSTIAKKINLVIVDEAHQSIAERYQSVIEILINSNIDTKLLGLSATPGRTWNEIEEDKRLSEFFNKNKVTLQIQGYSNPVNYLVDNEYISNVQYRNLDYVNTEDVSKYLTNINNNKDFSKEVLTMLGKDSDRNLVIIKEIIRLSKNHKRILVFSPSVESSEIVSKVLKLKGYNINSISSGTDPELRRVIIKNFKQNDDEVKIISNYGVLTTGFDSPNTSAALIARPTLSLVLYSQMVGRAIRGIKAGGNKHAEIVTVVDTELPGFRSVADSFYNWEDVWDENS
jgi:DNA repair protein RadD